MDVSIFGLATVVAITVLCYLVGIVVKATPFDNNKYIPMRLCRPSVGPCGPIFGHARVSGHRPHHGGGCGCSVRPCRYGY